MINRVLNLQGYTDLLFGPPAPVRVDEAPQVLAHLTAEQARLARERAHTAEQSPEAPGASCLAEVKAAFANNTTTIPFGDSEQT